MAATIDSLPFGVLFVSLHLTALQSHVDHIIPGNPVVPGNPVFPVDPAFVVIEQLFQLGTIDTAIAPMADFII